VVAVMSRLHEGAKAAQKAVVEFDSVFSHAATDGAGPMFSPTCAACVHSCDNTLLALLGAHDQKISLEGTNLGACAGRLFQAINLLVHKLRTYEVNSLTRLWTYARPRHRISLLAAQIFLLTEEVLLCMERDSVHRKILRSCVKTARRRDKRLKKLSSDVATLLCTDPSCLTVLGPHNKKESSWWASKFGAGTALVEWTRFIDRFRTLAKLDRALEPVVRYFVDFCATGVVSVYSFAAFAHAFGPLQDCGGKLLREIERPAFHGYLTPPECSRLLAGQPAGAYAIFVTHLELPRGQEHNMVVTSVMSCCYMGAGNKVEVAPITTSVDEFVERFVNICKQPFETPLTSMAWFYGDINSNEAADRLATAKPGSWLCRFSSQSLTSLALSYLSSEGVVQAAVLDQPSPNRVVYQGKDFPSVRALISQLSKNVLKIPVVLTTFATRQRQMSYTMTLPGITDAPEGSTGGDLRVMDPETMAAASNVGGGGLYGDLPTDAMFAEADGRLVAQRGTGHSATVGGSVGGQMPNPSLLGPPGQAPTGSEGARAGVLYGQMPSFRQDEGAPVPGASYGKMPAPGHLDGAMSHTAAGPTRLSSQPSATLRSQTTSYGKMPTPGALTRLDAAVGNLSVSESQLPGLVQGSGGQHYARTQSTVSGQAPHISATLRSQTASYGMMPSPGALARLDAATGTMSTSDPLLPGATPASDNQQYARTQSTVSGQTAAHYGKSPFATAPEQQQQHYGSVAAPGQPGAETSYGRSPGMEENIYGRGTSVTAPAPPPVRMHRPGEENIYGRGTAVTAPAPPPVRTQASSGYGHMPSPQAIDAARQRQSMNYGSMPRPEANTRHSVAYGAMPTPGNPRGPPAAAAPGFQNFT
jgi:CBL proto-oncogene N-terminus, EF hand-like domain/SH2 domain